MALGGNVGHRGEALARLRERLDGGAAGVRVAAASRQLVTRAVGVRDQPDFLNQVVRLTAPVPLAPHAWLELCQEAERGAGRRPTYRWGPRRADADLLLLGEDGAVRVDEPGLTVPHPRLGERPFLCALLAELDPALRHPDGWAPADRAGVFLRTRTADREAPPPRP